MFRRVRELVAAAAVKIGFFADYSAQRPLEEFFRSQKFCA